MRHCGTIMAVYKNIAGSANKGTALTFNSGSVYGDNCVGNARWLLPLIYYFKCSKMQSAMYTALVDNSYSFLF